VTTRPKVTHQEVHWVPRTRRVALGRAEVPYRVWTLYGPGRDDPKAPPALPLAPVHHQGAFLEDKLHDWGVSRRFADGPVTIRYYSRAAQDSVWILVEYAG
jgi:hypothetical protein